MFIKIHLLVHYYMHTGFIMCTGFFCVQEVSRFLRNLQYVWEINKNSWPNIRFQCQPISSLSRIVCVPRLLLKNKDWNTQKYILLLLLYRFETWSLTLQEEYRFHYEVVSDTYQSYFICKTYSEIKVVTHNPMKRNSNILTYKPTVTAPLLKSVERSNRTHRNCLNRIYSKVKVYVLFMFILCILIN